LAKKTRQNVIPIQISGEKSLFSQKRVANISPSSNSLGESVANSLSIGYTFNGPVQNYRQFLLKSGFGGLPLLLSYKIDFFFY
jgi:hypothetical protein